MIRKTTSMICLLVLMIIPIFTQACEEAAKFEVVSLDVVPPTVMSGERATVRAEIENGSTSLETYTVPLMVNGIAESRKSITLKPGAKQTIEFSLVRSKPGTYKIAIGERSSTLEVQKTIPAAFKVSNLEINPTTADIGEKIVITAKIVNTGGTQGSYVAELKIDGDTYQIEKVIMASGADYMLVFKVSADSPGTYPVSVGELTGKFVINETVRPIPVNNPECPPPAPGSRRPVRC